MASAYLPHLGHVKLSVADRTMLLSRSPAPTCEIDIVDIEYDFSETPSVATVTALTVKGLAWGVSKVALTVQSAAILTPLVAQPSVGTAGTWSRTFTLAAPVPVGTTIQVLAVAPVGGSCNASASLSLALHLAPDPVVTDPGSCSAGFQHERNRFVAGHPDRLVRTRSFVPLAASAYAMTKHQKSAMAKHMIHSGLSRRKAHQVVDGFAAKLSNTGRMAMRKLGAVSEAQARRAHPAMYKKAVSAALRTMSTLAKRASKASHKKTVVGTLPGGVDVAIKLPPASDGMSVNKAAAGASAALRHSHGNLGTVHGTNVNLAAGVTKYALSAWLGVLFYDRLRFRAAGLARIIHQTV